MQVRSTNCHVVDSHMCDSYAGQQTVIYLTVTRVTVMQVSSRNCHIFDCELWHVWQLHRLGQQTVIYLTVTCVTVMQVISTSCHIFDSELSHVWQVMQVNKLSYIWQSHVWQLCRRGFCGQSILRNDTWVIWLNSDQCSSLFRHITTSQIFLFRISGITQNLKHPL